MKYFNLITACLFVLISFKTLAFQNPTGCYQVAIEVPSIVGPSKEVSSNGRVCIYEKDSQPIDGENKVFQGNYTLEIYDEAKLVQSLSLKAAIKTRVLSYDSVTYVESLEDIDTDYDEVIPGSYFAEFLLNAGNQEQELLRFSRTRWIIKKQK